MPKVVQSDNPLVQASTGSQQGHDRRGNNNVFHHRRQTKWATFNVNGLRTAHKCRCLEIDLLRYDIDILCVQELHMRSTGRMDFGKQHTLLYSGSENSSHHGVGIIMKKAKATVVQVRIRSRSILFAKAAL